MMNEIHQEVNPQTSRNDFICGVIEGFYGKPWSFDQRRDLFKTMKMLNLNAFLYAPKDDTKHRANWRQLYSQQEAEELKCLIKEADYNGINFYYSLAPGLDMIYSQQSDIDILIRKYQQLVELGCKSFAILFDDIEPDLINDKDKKVFDNYAKAQVTIANMIYNYLKKPNFLFCPTEYCESRAIPNVNESIYLNTIGLELENGIDFLWSGSRVISRLITRESIEQLTKVIRRPPVIWENLHANDYDKKRVFLGPYSGRSTDIIPKIKGVMTNPNCEYEANYIAIHTLAQWSKCTEDINLHNKCNNQQQKELLNYYYKNNSNDNNNLESYILDKTIQNSSILPAPITRKSIYNPHQALINAIKDWLPHLHETKALTNVTNLNNLMETRNDQTASNQLLKDENITIEESNNVDMFLEETSRQSVNSISTNKSEMDTCNSPNDQINENVLINDVNTCDSCDMTDVTEATTSSIAVESAPATTTTKLKERENDLGIFNQSIPLSGDNSCCDIQQQQQQIISCQAINFENLALLIDLFYLPFEHGLYGSLLLNDIKWLKDNSDVIFNTKESSPKESSQKNVQSQQEESEIISDVDYDKEIQMKDSSEQQFTIEYECKTIEFWDEKAKKLNELCAYLRELINNLIHDCPNKLLIIELYPYLADVRDVTNLIIDYIKFLRHRISPVDRFYYCNNSIKQKQENIFTDEQEPWVHRGGFIGDVQRLISA